MLRTGALEEALDTALRGRRCIQAWLGYGEVLFLGFGNSVLPPPWPAPEPTCPPYELETRFADWSIEGSVGTLGSIEDTREQALASCESLVGRRVTAWQLDLATFTLTVRFDADLSLKIVPWSEEEDFDTDAWGLSNPAGEYLYVACGGKLYLLRRDEPLASVRRHAERRLRRSTRRGRE
jgi:hypothetical protein